jgi:hypothetical protein
MRGVRTIALLALFLLAGCDFDATHVVGPFYLLYIDLPEQTALYRCPDGPNGRLGCAVDGLPDATVFAAGGDDRYVVVARHPQSDKGVTQYFYFHRVPQERSGWGNNPEKIVGPLTEGEFNADKVSLHLPDFSVTKDELK